jgi:hypothetical protein
MSFALKRKLKEKKGKLERIRMVIVNFPIDRNPCIVYRKYE